jgi:hypothetical protein
VVWVWSLFWLTVAAVLSVLAAMLIAALFTAFRGGEALRDRLRRRRGQQAQVQPVELLAADLHRLAVNLDSLEHSREMHRVARLRAASLAYDDVLRSACRTLEVEVPDSTPMHPVERLQTEAALAQRGLVW